jgi:hypothetical protein
MRWKWDQNRRFRYIAAGIGAVGGVVVLMAGQETALGIALLILSLFIVTHCEVEAAFQHVRTGFEPPAEGGMREFASSFIATSGVVLGLLAVFGDHPFSTTIKVGIGALVSDILLGFVLIALLLSGPAPDDTRGWNFIRYIFNAALWALSLGLLCIALALISGRTSSSTAEQTPPAGTRSQPMPPTHTVPGTPPTHTVPGTPPTHTVPGTPPTHTVPGTPTHTVPGMPPTHTVPGTPPTPQTTTMIPNTQ